MKKIFFVVAFFFTVNSMAQTPPPAVQAAFSKTYPDAKMKKWEKENGKYEADFIIDGVQTSAAYNADGTLEETEYAIAVSALPASIITHLQTLYKSTTIKEASIIKKPSGEKMYEAEINKKDLLFDMSGNFLGEEKK